jgi:hypothetical protein
MSKLEEGFVPYDIALELKKIGYTEECWSYFMLGVFNHSMFPKSYEYLIQMKSVTEDQFVLAPLYQEVFEWFRKEYKMKFHIREDIWNNYCCPNILVGEDYKAIGVYPSYKEAEIELIKQLINQIKHHGLVKKSIKL